jgi:hypothetical protein
MFFKSKTRIAAAAGMSLIQLCSSSYPQDLGPFLDQAEESFQQDELARIPLEAFESAQELSAGPLDLNSATLQELEASGLFTPFQARMVAEYRQRHGRLLSIYELASIPGFRKNQIQQIADFITLNGNRATVRSAPRNIRMLVSAGASFPELAGPGSSIAASFRMKARLGTQLSAGLAYQKDPGERAFPGGRPEFLNGYIYYQGKGALEDCIAGNFRLHHGTGLVQGSGLLYSVPGFHPHPMVRATLKPYAGTSETGTHRGLCCRVNLQPIKLTAWLSHLPLDLSLGGVMDPKPGVDWVSLRRESGSHRTPLEISGRSLGYLFNAGIQGVWIRNSLLLGAQLTLESSGLNQAGRDSLQVTGDRTTFIAGSLFWLYSLQKLEIYGEASSSGKNRSAILSGVNYDLNDFMRCGLQLHWYGLSHRETFSSAYGSGSHISNERGLSLRLHIEPIRGLLADLMFELFGYPSQRSTSLIPSRAYRYSCLFHNGETGKLQWRISVIRKSWQVTPAGETPGIRPITGRDILKLEGRVAYSPLPGFSWQTRLAASLVCGDHSSPGIAASQQVRIGERKVKCSLQFVVFHISCWDGRIYLYQPGLYQQFSFPVCYGTGQRLTGVVSYKAGRRLSLEGKLSWSNALDPVSGRIEAGVQLGLTL